MRGPPTTPSVPRCNTDRQRQLEQGCIANRAVSLDSLRAAIQEQDEAIRAGLIDVGFAKAPHKVSDHLEALHIRMLMLTVRTGWSAVRLMS
jgi:hypothetical protein